MKKILSIALAVVMVLSIASVAAAFNWGPAASSGDSFGYGIDVIKYTRSTGEIGSSYFNADDAATAVNGADVYFAIKLTVPDLLATNGIRANAEVEIDATAISGFDGGTYDIGFQSLSGATERGHDLTYVCYDNEAYMNTGIQRSSSTPRFAKATTSPVGTVIPGKTQNKKNLTDIIAAHNVPYVAQTTFIGNFRDLYTKAKKAIYTPGPSFLNVMAPCPRGWEYPTEKLPEICKLAVETCVWPLFEVIDGVWHLSYEPKQKRPVEEYLRMQGRFRHMFKPGNEWMIEAVQQNVDENWEKLLNRCNQ